MKLDLSGPTFEISSSVKFHENPFSGKRVVPCGLKDRYVEDNFRIFVIFLKGLKISFNHLTPNGHYSGRTAPLTSKRCILYIYSTNIGTEYFKHGIYSPFLSLKMQFVS